MLSLLLLPIYFSNLGCVSAATSPFARTDCPSTKPLIANYYTAYSPERLNISQLEYQYSDWTFYFNVETTESGFNYKDQEDSIKHFVKTSRDRGSKPILVC